MEWSCFIWYLQNFTGLSLELNYSPSHMHVHTSNFLCWVSWICSAVISDRVPCLLQTQREICSAPTVKQYLRPHHTSNTNSVKEIWTTERLQSDPRLDPRLEDRCWWYMDCSPSDLGSSASLSWFCILYKMSILFIMFYSSLFFATYFC